MSDIQKLIDYVEALPTVLSAAVEEANQTIIENNQLIDENQALTEELNKFKESHMNLEKLFAQQGEVIKAAVEHKKKDVAATKILQAQVNEYRKMDPKRLEKLNKRYKTERAELKEKLEASEKQRKAALAENKRIAAMAQTNGTAALFHDPESRNAIRVIPNLYVGKGNKLEGVVGSPVLEFMHHHSGITRQGFLNTDGTMSWASAKNAMPSTDESLFARDWIKQFCKTKKVKV